MRIGIDARLYTQTGVGRYLRNLIDELGRVDCDNDYVVYFRAQEIDSYTPPNKRWEKKLLNVRWHTLREQFIVPRFLLSDRLDVVHFPYFNVPILYPKKYLLTIHDLIVDHFDTGRASTLPSFFYQTKRLAYAFSMKRGICRAEAITVISRTTRQEVIEHYTVPAQKLFVTYDALDLRFQQALRTHRAKKLYPFPYLLYVGNAYPHKNLECFLRAVSLLRKKRTIAVVLAGDDPYFYPRLRDFSKAIGLSDAVHFFGKANDDALIDLYTHCRALIFPSLMEGFGLPTLEALACHVLPVVSDIPVFRELWGGLLDSFDPTHPPAIAKTIDAVLGYSDAYYAEKVRGARNTLSRFSWEHTARKTISLYQAIHERE